MSGYAPTVVPHGYSEGVADCNTLRGVYQQLLDACDDVRVENLQAVEQGDVVRPSSCCAAGTAVSCSAHLRRADFELRGATSLRFKEGLLVERWQHADDLGLLLRALPARPWRSGPTSSTLRPRR